ncbi:hypothetical protein B0H10DRAFT_2226465 [Mycena sp. CBHHK59/15]|nr:hypothetical protein B0H10DRAFT_2226465 [Mycena sp. CBHHK59/15]
MPLTHLRALAPINLRAPLTTSIAKATPTASSAPTRSPALRPAHPCIPASSSRGPHAPLPLPAHSRPASGRVGASTANLAPDPPPPNVAPREHSAWTLLPHMHTSPGSSTTLGRVRPPCPWLAPYGRQEHKIGWMFGASGRAGRPPGGRGGATSPACTSRLSGTPYRRQPTSSAALPAHAHGGPHLRRCDVRASPTPRRMTHRGHGLHALCLPPPHSPHTDPTAQACLACMLYSCLHACHAPVPLCTPSLLRTLIDWEVQDVGPQNAPLAMLFRRRVRAAASPACSIPAAAHPSPLMCRPHHLLSPLPALT